MLHMLSRWDPLRKGPTPWGADAQSGSNSQIYHPVILGPGQVAGCLSAYKKGGYETCPIPNGLV